MESQKQEANAFHKRWRDYTKANVEIFPSSESQPRQAHGATLGQGWVVYQCETHHSRVNPSPISGTLFTRVAASPALVTTLE